MTQWPEGFDLDLLLAPIEGDAAVGTDLRENFSPQSPYYRLRDARAEARAAERIADADPDAEFVLPPQWRDVRGISTKALAEQTKDLEIAAWFTEALVRSDGLIGLAAGARLIGGLAERFWEEGVFPLPDEDGIATRVAPITGLNGEGGDGTLIQPLRKLGLFPRPDGGTYALWQYEQSAELEAIADSTRRQQRLDAGTVPFEAMERAARATGAARLGALRAQVEDALAAWEAMGETLDQRAGSDGPPTSRVRDLLRQVLAIIEKYAPAEAGSEESAGPGDAAAGGEGGGVGGGGAGGGPARGATREDMLRDLGRIAEFFRRTEPHSPLAYTLDEAVRRGRMSWPELMTEIVPDASTRYAILTSLGIKPPEAE
ncbi:MAG: type VI secretion system protein TssA [Rhodospirillales bacterium]|nr:type VI secretion system protein TssA [Rhodospirillales bacterium]